jgi:hypothetical protein
MAYKEAVDENMAKGGYLETLSSTPGARGRY